MLNRGKLVGKNSSVDDVVRNFASQMIILCMKFDTFCFLYICLTFIGRLFLVCCHVICVNSMLENKKSCGYKNLQLQ